MVKATLRKNITTQPLTGRGAVIDVEATVVQTDSAAGSAAAKNIGNHTVDTDSADKLAAELDAGAPVPGSDEAAAEEIADNNQQALTTMPQGAPPAIVGAYSESSGGALEGEFGSSDLRLPQLKIVNGSGELSQKFNQGTLLYADELLWTPPDLREGAKNPVMRFVPLKITKQFRENLTQDEIAEGLMPRIANSTAEARSMGGSTEWVNNQKPRWSPSARCIFLLEEPEGCEHPGFTTQLDGKNWALAIFYASGMGYNESAKAIFNAAQISLKENGKTVLHSRVWTWQVVKKKGGQFMVFVPSLRLTRDVTGPDVRDQAAFVLGKPIKDAGE